MAGAAEAGAGIPRGVLQPIASYNEGMLAMLASGHLCQYEFTEAQRHAFHEGYLLGINDSMVLLGTTIAVASFCLTLLVPSLYLPLREVLQPFCVARVEREHEWLVRLQRYEHPALTWAFKFIGATGGIGFYITFLPFMFWIGEVRLARQLTVFMSTCIYVGNALKDTICSPRPNWENGVKHRTHEDGDTEYGVPSTHTINSICLCAYLFHHYNWYGIDGTTKHPQGRYLYENLGETYHVALLAGVVVWCSIVCYSRLYLGMHSPVDVLSGVLVAAFLVFFWISCESFLDAWMTQGFMVPVIQFLFNVALAFAYPKPEKKTPSYTFVIYFLGAAAGMSAGVWCSYDRFHSPEGVARIKAARGSLLTTAGFLWSVRRFVVGIAIVLVARELGKRAAKVFVPWLAGVLGVESSDHDAIHSAERRRAAEAKKTDGDGGSGGSEGAVPSSAIEAIRGYNTNTGVRVLTYTAVGWTVSQVCPHVFEMLNI